ncbi:hypothetical protein [Psychroflexus lacisalsi]|uniref:Uncharacterized protein n=1 Tax=Psychroflexus lacisalsi TaxID=503928 RepID=A0ABN1KDT1_9FLAO|nr:hypothetical protein [Psychroflexus lacisalsi]MBZ9620143.1 hypothetical protein [Psychroflexus lacisalsi]
MKIKDNYFTIEVDLRPLKDKGLLKTVEKECKFNHLKPELSKIEEKVFAIKTYHPSKKEKINLTQFISHKLVEDGFIEIFNKLNDILTKEKPKSSHS